MVRFTAIIKKYGAQGEKTGWTIIEIPSSIALQLKPANKKAFRVKGLLDEHPFNGISLVPIGEGNFILPLKAALRKVIRKAKGDKIQVVMEVDEAPVLPPDGLMECLEDEPEAVATFNKMPGSHQRYYFNWIKSAKTEETKAKRIAMTINSLINKMDFGQMLRADKSKRDGLKEL